MKRLLPVAIACALAPAVRWVALGRAGEAPGQPAAREDCRIGWPLRDAAICRGPDKTFYLTGTTDTNTLEPKHADSQNNEGVRLWESTDLKKWTEVGLVWEIDRDARRSPKSAWQLERRLNPDDPAGPLVRGITAPEVHSVRKTFWLTYSMNGHGTGLLRSTTGKAEGPYEDVGRITARGSDASLFADDDGSVYWVWGAGWIAKMTPDMTALAEPPRCLLVDLSVHADQAHPHDEPIRPRGPFLCKAEVRLREGRRWVEKVHYILTFSAGACRLGQSVQDTFAVPGDSVYGPYRNPKGYHHDLTLIGDNGQTTIFADAEGDLHATFWGADDRAVFRDRPGIVPLEAGEGTLHKPNYNQFTDAGPWAQVEPLVRDVQMNDTQLLKDLLAPFEGRTRGLLWAVSPKDGRKIAEVELASPPVFDGLAVATRTLYVSTRDGHVLCLAAKP